MANKTNKAAKKVTASDLIALVELSNLETVLMRVQEMQYLPIDVEPLLKQVQEVLQQLIPAIKKRLEV